MISILCSLDKSEMHQFSPYSLSHTRFYFIPLGFTKHIVQVLECLMSHAEDETEKLRRYSTQVYLKSVNNLCKISVHAHFHKRLIYRTYL